MEIESIMNRRCKPLKTVLMLALFGLFPFTAKSQSVKEFFYPENKTIIIRHSDKGKINYDSNNFIDNQIRYDSKLGELANTYMYQGRSPSSSVKKIEVTSNTIVSTAEQSTNMITGESYSRERVTMLRLPDIGKTITWAKDGETCTATLVNLQIEVNNEKKTIVAIKVENKKTEVNWGDLIEYWGKGSGLVLSVTNSGVLNYNTSIGLTSLSYTELPIDSIEPKTSNILSSKPSTNNKREISERQLQERQLQLQELQELPKQQNIILHHKNTVNLFVKIITKIKNLMTISGSEFLLIIIVFLYVIVWLLMLWITVEMARQRGRSQFGWFLIAFLLPLPFLTGICLFFLGDTDKRRIDRLLEERRYLDSDEGSRIVKRVLKEEGNHSRYYPS